MDRESEKIFLIQKRKVNMKIHGFQVKKENRIRFCKKKIDLNFILIFLIFKVVLRVEDLQVLIHIKYE